MRFEWDCEKDQVNQSKHGLSFSEAKELFLGEADYLEVFDETHSIDEDRFIAIGVITKGVIVVVWVECEEDVVRIISARIATDQERQRYRQFMEKQQ